MNCKKAESMVNPYIDGTLEPYELEEFIKHIRTCPSCYDELETYYTIRVAMKYLDQGQSHSYNIKDMLSEDMKEKEKYVKRVKFKRRSYASLITIATILLFVVFLLQIDLEQFFQMLEETAYFIGIR